MFVLASLIGIAMIGAAAVLPSFGDDAADQEDEALARDMSQDDGAASRPMAMLDFETPDEPETQDIATLLEHLSEGIALDGEISGGVNSGITAANSAYAPSNVAAGLDAFGAENTSEAATLDATLDTALEMGQKDGTAQDVPAASAPFDTEEQDLLTEFPNLPAFLQGKMPFGPDLSADSPIPDTSAALDSTDLPTEGATALAKGPAETTDTLDPDDPAGESESETGPETSLGLFKTITSGTDGDDVISGQGDNNDEIGGGAGNDILRGGAGLDDLFGGDGNDTLTGGTGNDHLHGQNGDDVLDGGSDDDIVLGYLGHDTLIGGTGDDAMIGGMGDDVMSGGLGDDAMQGGHGNDILVGGTGTDTMIGDKGNDIIVGASFANGLIDTDDTDFIDGGDGDDTILAGAGDYVNGGAGNDTFYFGEWTANNMAVIQDFRVGEDDLVVVYDDAEADVPDLGLHEDPDNPSNILVTLNGTNIAVLDGVSHISMADLRTIPFSVVNALSA